MTEKTITKRKNPKGTAVTAALCVLLAALMLLPLLLPLGLSYFEYLAKYGVLINGDGSINQNAFGVLNDDAYRGGEYGYGVTPENPFVIENINHLYNLIKLNNTGRMLDSKIRNGVYEIPQYYFVLNFTAQPLPQVLDLAGAETASVGNNAYPFIDRFSGLIYAYRYSEDSYIYLSGLMEPAEVTVDPVSGDIAIDGVVTDVMGEGVAPGKYVKIPPMYVDFVEEEGALGVGNTVYVPLSSLCPYAMSSPTPRFACPTNRLTWGFSTPSGGSTSWRRKAKPK